MSRASALPAAAWISPRCGRCSAGGGRRRGASRVDAGRPLRRSSLLGRRLEGEVQPDLRAMSGGRLAHPDGCGHGAHQGQSEAQSRTLGAWAEAVAVVGDVDPHGPAATSMATVTVPGPEAGNACRTALLTASVRPA